MSLFFDYIYRERQNDDDDDKEEASPLEGNRPLFYRSILPFFDNGFKAFTSVCLILLNVMYLFAGISF